MIEISNGCNEFRIFGSPGCGKTTSLTAQIQADADTYGEESVLACTLTKAAAVELGGRNLSLEHCGTLHSICFRLLGAPPVADDKKLLVEWNDIHSNYAMTGSGSSDVDDGGGTVREDATAGDELYQEYQIKRAQMIDRKKWNPGLLNFAEQWERWKQSKGAVDYTDMIEIPYREKIAPPSAVQVAFMDEAQDMDLLSLSLFRQWGEQLEHIVFAGDDDQAIYGFRGSDPEAWLGIQIPQDHINIRPQSYRLPRVIHEAANRWIEQLTFRQPKSCLPRHEEGTIRYLSADRNYPEDILPEIESFLSAGKTLMVLASCGYMLNSLKVVLKSEGIPFHNPWRTKRGDWNPLGFHRQGVTARERLLAFLAPDQDRTHPTGRMLWTGTEVSQWTNVLKIDGVLNKNMRTTLEKLEDNNEVTMKDLHLWFQEIALPRALELSLDWFCESLLNSKKKIYEYPVNVVKKRGAQALIDEPKLTIGTIHSTKGGEADVVILFPDLPPSAAEDWVSGDRDAIIRQFYVGMTRAKETLIVCDSANDACVEGLV